MADRLTLVLARPWGSVFAFNMIGDGLGDALDPRLRGIL
jgi:hypothetical protein